MLPSIEDMKRFAATLERMLNEEAVRTGQPKTLFALVMTQPDGESRETIRFICNAKRDHMMRILSDLAEQLEQMKELADATPESETAH